MKIEELQSILDSAGVTKYTFSYLEKDRQAEGFVLCKDSNGYTLTLRERRDVDLIDKYANEGEACEGVLKCLAPFYKALQKYI